MARTHLHMRAKWADEAPEDYHPLICHLLDTGHVAQAIARDFVGEGMRTWLAKSFHVTEADLVRWLGYWASLHDIGKATPAFQLRCETGAEELARQGFSFTNADRLRPHGNLTGRILKRAMKGDRCPASDVARSLRIVLAGHHGVFPSTSNLGRDVRDDDVGREEWRAQQDAVMSALADRWRIAELPAPSDPADDEQAVWMVVAGLVCVADWLASCVDFFPYAGPNVDVEAYCEESASRAGDAMVRGGFHRAPTPSVVLDFRKALGFAANTVQAQVVAAAGELPGPGLILIETPTGSGKTEAAFAAVHDGLRRLGSGGAYFALPTQATSDQIFRRFCEFAPVLGGEDGVIQTQLTHGQAVLNEDLLRLRANHIGDDGDSGGLVASEWFAASKRGLLSPYGVGTVDQALMAVLQVRHAFVRLFGLAGKVVVLDEVHAYDAYTSGLLEHLLRWLGALRCPVVLLSATLPTARRRALAAAYLGHEPAETATRYPRLTIAAANGSECVAIPAEEDKRIALSWLEDDTDAIAAEIASSLAGGGCAACICNTVDRAQRVYAALADRLEATEVHLLHARFPAGRRRDIERRMMRAFGKPGWREGRPRKAVLVATQVVEQSLDVDFDLMVTDPAPADLLLQRAGRLHRHHASASLPVRRAESLQDPRLCVIMPQLDEDGLPDLGVHELIYDRYTLLATYRTLTEHYTSAIRIPDDTEGLIESVYAEDPPTDPEANWQAALAAAHDELLRERRKDEYVADVRTIPDPAAPDGVLNQFNRQMPEDETIAAKHLGGLTRKARPSVQLVCLHDVDGRACLDPAGREPVDLNTPPDRCALMRLLDAGVKVSRWDVVEAYHDEPVPAPWRRCPVLRNCKPLLLIDGRRIFGRTVLRLDPDLGIVLERREEA